MAQFGGSVVCFGFLFGSLIILVFIGLTHIPAAAQAITAAGLPAFANIPLFAGYTLENLPVVLYVSAGVAGVGFCAYFMAMEYQPASIVSLVYFFKPALSPVLAWALHGRRSSEYAAGDHFDRGGLLLRHCAWGDRDQAGALPFPLRPIEKYFPIQKREERTKMPTSKVYFTDLRTQIGVSQLDKLEKLIAPPESATSTLTTR